MHAGVAEWPGGGHFTLKAPHRWLSCQRTESMRSSLVVMVGSPPAGCAAFGGEPAGPIPIVLSDSLTVPTPGTPVIVRTCTCVLPVLGPNATRTLGDPSDTPGTPGDLALS